MINIGEGVRVCRESMGLSREQLAARLGITNVQMARYELMRNIPADELVRISDKLGVTAADIVREGGKKSNDV